MSPEYEVYIPLTARAGNMIHVEIQPYPENFKFILPYNIGVGDLVKFSLPEEGYNIYEIQLVSSSQ
jgi:hypothetical protein